MPTLTPLEIRAAIDDGKVFAITIDTVVFDAKGRIFQNTVLHRLDQFHNMNIRVIITDVVAKEMKAHFRDEALETQRALKKALRAHSNRWGRKEGKNEKEQLKIVSDPTAFAEDEFSAFLKHINGEIIKVAETPDAVERVMKLYFDQKPPFGPAEKRKSEFPDAFALLRLERLAKDAGKLLICVSPDKGWVEFAEQSTELVCIERLEDALALFNEADQHIADAIVNLWRNATDGEFLEEIANAFERNLDDLYFDSEGDADVMFETEPISAVMQSVNLIGNPKVIAGDLKTVTFTVRVEALIGFTASFSFYVMDSIDRDHVNLGSQEPYIEEQLSFDITITADRTLKDGPIFHEVEVAKRPILVDFGFVDAFPGEDPTHEKY